MNYNDNVFRVLRSMRYTEEDFKKQEQEAEKEAENCLISELKENNYNVFNLRKTGSFISLSNLIESDRDRIKEILGRDITNSEVTYIMMEIYD